MEKVWKIPLDEKRAKRFKLAKFMFKILWMPIIVGLIFGLLLHREISNEAKSVYEVKTEIGGKEADYICYACYPGTGGEMDFEDLKTGKKIAIRGNYTKTEIERLTKKELEKKYKLAKVPF